MKQFGDLADDRLKGICPYCGGIGTTRDHVPPRAFLEKPYPEYLPVVPACRDCNSKYSADEEYVAVLLEFILTGADGDDANPNLVRALDRRPSLEARLFGALGADGNGVCLEPETSRIQRVIEKVARGHALYEFSEAPLGSPTSCVTFFLQALQYDAKSRFEEVPVTSTWPELGSRAFQRLAACASFDDGGRLVPQNSWQVVQTGSYRYLPLLGSGALTEVRVVIRETLAGIVRWTR